MVSNLRYWASDHTDHDTSGKTVGRTEELYGVGLATSLFGVDWPRQPTRLPCAI